MKAVNLKTEHLVNPIGIDIRTPYLSWNCEGGKKQTAYQIDAMADGEVILNSGKIASDKMNHCFGVAARFTGGDRRRACARPWDALRSIHG